MNEYSDDVKRHSGHSDGVPVYQDRAVREDCTLWLCKQGQTARSSVRGVASVYSELC